MLSIFMNSCGEEAKWETPEIALTPIYEITEIAHVNGTNSIGGFFKIEVYRVADKTFLIEFPNSQKANKYQKTNYQDTSTDTEYKVSFTKKTEARDYNFDIEIDKANNTGTIEVSYDDGTGTIVVENYTANMDVKDVYN